jgi:hypothetical protein
MLLALTAHDASAEDNLPLQGTGDGVLKSVGPGGDVSFSYGIKLHNRSEHPLRVVRAEVLLLSAGGWARSLGDQIKETGKLFGNSPILQPGAEYSLRFNYGYSSPITHSLIALQYTGATDKPEYLMLQVPITRSGSEAPERLDIVGPAFLSLQEPIEVLGLTNGAVWLPLIGQIVNTSGKPFTLQRWHMVLKDTTGKTVFDRALSRSLKLKDVKKLITPFVYGFNLSKEFRAGSLQLEAEIELDSQRSKLSHAAEVHRVEGVMIRSPVDGQWQWHNGPGELRLHSHFENHEQRYAYDLLVARNLGGPRATFAGSRNKNENFFAWDQPIRCVQDGRVLLVEDGVPDNFGMSENPANQPRRNSSIVVEHDDGSRSIYTHVRKGSATVSVGQKVKAGDILAHVGNAGFSSEPHLHFAYIRADSTGRMSPVPVRIEGLRHLDGRPAVGVPLGDTEFVSNTAAEAPGGSN